MPEARLARFALLPELEMTDFRQIPGGATQIDAHKTSEMEVCPRCASPSRTGYDHRYVTVKDEPMRHNPVVLRIKKRRFYCKPCRKPFTEPISGISKGRRFTERFRRAILWACERFSDMKAVRDHFQCSYGFIYKSLYDLLKTQLKHNIHSWPVKIGIDEHRFGKDSKTGATRFATFFVSHSRNKRAFEIVEGRSKEELMALVAHIKGRDAVRIVTMDMSGPYRSFTKTMFPNATIICDKFHVLRLLTPAINRCRKEITGDRRSLKVRRLLLRNGCDLEFKIKSELHKWLANHPKLRDIYLAKEAMHRLYRTHGYNKARNAFKKLLDELGTSPWDELKTLRRTLLSWQNEILAYFKNKYTNARVEGFNNVAKTIIKRGYGYQSFENYRLRVLRACC
ncbi:MAG: ISL3 family transposase [Proteobacteria bacterium]|nr:MAG: ISL3 family transposase [Pseudomonadota bacterium]